MKKIVNYLSVILVLSIGYQMQAKDPLPLYEKYADQITNSFIDEMEKEHKIYCCGSGGRMPHDVEEFTIGFIAHRPVTIEQARKLEVSVIEKLVNRINAHEKIRPFLREYPFPQKRIGIFIAFKKKDGSRYSEDCIAFVTHAKNTIFYQKYDSLADKYVDFYEEPYDEAVKIFQEKSSS